MKEKVLEILKEVKKEYEFYESIDLIKEGILDSFDIVDLATALDKEYQISIEGEDISSANFRNLEAICKVLRKNGVKQ
jgi:acyl carrier protein